VRYARLVGRISGFYRDRIVKRVAFPLSSIMVRMRGAQLATGNHHFMNARGRCFAMMMPVDKLFWLLNTQTALTLRQL
jgi:formate/nitrite transporter FocA (FNT family)